MPECALPDHLKGLKHGDWPWPFSQIFTRGSNAYGPRCGAGAPGYLPWPPKLIEGHGIARWEDTGSTSIIEIPVLADRTVKADDVYGQSFQAVERKWGHANFGKTFLVKLEWNETTYDGKDFWPQQYSPSALQKFSQSGWMRLNPKYTSYWHILKWRELPALRAGLSDADFDDAVLFFRKWNRPDHGDVYYNGEGALPVGYAGFKWE